MEILYKEEMEKYAIGISSISNARELGGIAIGDKKIKKGKLLRSGELNKVSGEDLDILEKKFKIKMIIDFRMSGERMMKPDPEISGVENIFLPVMELQDYPGYDKKMAAKLSGIKDRYELLKLSYEMGALDDNLYVEFLFNEKGKKAYRSFFEKVLSLPEEGSVLWHCADGKDRAGLASMLILTALGADRETIMKDYLLTNAFNEKKIKAAEEKPEISQITGKMKEILMFGTGAVYDYYLDNALKAMDEQCGSAPGYINNELGIGNDAIEEMKVKFLV